MKKNLHFAADMTAGAALFLALGLFAHLLFFDSVMTGPQPETPSEKECVMEITASQLEELINSLVPVPLQQTSVSVQATGEICCKAVLSKSDLQQMVDAGNWGSVFLFLPDQCAISACWLVSAQNGIPSLAFQTASVAGFRVNEAIMKPLSASLNQAVQQWLAKENISFSTISCTKGKIQFWA